MRGGSRPILAAVAVVLGSLAVAGETHAWIFAGQSNMGGGHAAYSAELQAIVEAKGHGYTRILSAKPGKEIAHWLDPEAKDYELWRQLERGVAEARAARAQMRGAVWYQGESDVGTADAYGAKLATWIRRVRALCEEPELPVIVVQLATATSYAQHGAWSVGRMREVQRQVAEADARVGLVTAVDMELGDYTVHVGREGHRRLAKRIGAAARHLAYGETDLGYGPRFREARFADNTRKRVVVVFDGVQGAMKLDDGWRAGFAASPSGVLERDPPPARIEAADYIAPVGGAVLSSNEVGLLFDQALPLEARLNLAAARNATAGRARRWDLPFVGVTDDSGHHAPAFTMVPVGPAPESARRFPDIAVAGEPADGPRWIAINCVGRWPDGVLRPEDEAGAPPFRQRWWNAASSGPCPNLFDAAGRVTDLRFVTGVWYMNPVRADAEGADARMMSGWCHLNDWHVLENVPAGTHELIVYLDQPGKGEGAETVHVAVGRLKEDAKPGKNFRPDDARREQRLDIGFNVEVIEPRGKAGNHHFEDYVEATAANGWTGNWLRVPRVEAGSDGKVYLGVYRPRGVKPVDRQSNKAVLNGIQLLLK